jgi:hypothetical protein
MADIPSDWAVRDRVDVADAAMAALVADVEAIRHRLRALDRPAQTDLKLILQNFDSACQLRRCQLVNGIRQITALLPPPFPQVVGRCHRQAPSATETS